MKHTGGCHCGKVTFEVEMTIEKGMECNCSICQKRGSILDFVPATQFKLLTGQDSLKEYLFNKHVIHHEFCTNCGILSFSKGSMPDGTKMVAINLRCIDGIDLKSLKMSFYDGKSV